jgi:hypothetical protein
MAWTRYADRYYRDGFDRRVRPFAVAAVQWLINARRPSESSGLAQERKLEGEEAATEAIVAAMSAFTSRTYAHATAERAGNTKTYGVVHGTFEVLPNLPERFRRGVFATPRTFDIWVRFAGPGPLSPPDILDNGVLSLGVKLIGVDGPKLLDDERRTQDFTGISSPTFTTPDVIENAKLQRRLLQGLPAFYFLDPRDPHLLDAVMQGLYSRANTSPLEVTYWSCVPYLLGEGQAMRYAVHPASDRRSPIPRHPGANYLRDAMASTLAECAVEFDFRIQLQTDAQRMPIENASVVWPERLSRPRTVARIKLPPQSFDSPERHAWARTLSFQPWHCVPEHRPLGSQNRARRRIYYDLSKLRQSMNGDLRVEPDASQRLPRSRVSSRGPAERAPAMESRP